MIYYKMSGITTLHLSSNGGIIRSDPKSGTNTVGGGLTLRGGKGTGTGAGGSIILTVAPAGSSGSSLNDDSNVLTIDSSKLSTFLGELNIGVNGGDGGQDVKFYGNTNNAYMWWDKSNDDLKLLGGTGLVQSGNGTNTLTGPTTLSGGVTLSGTTTSSGNMNITSTTTSSSKTTGALTVTGGVGINENLHVGGTFDVNGNIKVRDGSNIEKFIVYSSSGNTEIDGYVTIKSDLSVQDSGRISLKGNHTQSTIFEFQKTQNDGSGNPTTPADGTTIGELNWLVHDGTQLQKAATIYAGVNGTAGTNDTPGQLNFGVTPDGSNTTTVYMLIKNDGEIEMSKTGVITRVKGQLVVNETSTLTGNTNITSTTESTTTSTGSLTVSGGVGITKNINVGGNAIVTGDLIVNGNTTTVNSTIVTIDDPIFTLGGDIAPSSDDNKDRGIEFRYHDGSNPQLGFFGYDDSDGKFTFLTAASNTSEVFSGTIGTVKANLEATSASIGALTSALTLNTQKELKFADANSSHYVAFKAPTEIVNNITWTLPAADASSGQVLSSNGSGVLSWINSSNSVSLSDITDITFNNTSLKESIYINGDSGFTPGTNSDNNVSLGVNTMININGGNNNTAVGYNAGTALTVGNNNTVVGHDAGAGLTTGDFNVIVGQEAGKSTQSAKDLVIIGYMAGNSAITSDADGTVIVGSNACMNLTSGKQNIAIGKESLFNIETGNNNTSLGYRSLKNVTASDNTSIGNYSGAELSTGTKNTLLGSEAGGSLVEGLLTVSNTLDANGTNTTTFTLPDVASVNSVANDHYNGSSITWGSSTSTVALRNDTYTIVDYVSGSRTVTVSPAMDDTPVSGDTYTITAKTITTGSNNTYIGCHTTGINTDDNQTSIGYNATCSSGNQITLGNSDVTALRCADTSIASLSDKRDKTNIVDSSYGLSFINTLRPVQYMWDRRNLEQGDSTSIFNGKTRVGFIAQELQSAMPNNENDILDLVYEVNPERLEAKYGNLIPILTKAIKELSAANDALVARVSVLENA